MIAMSSTTMGTTGKRRSVAVAVPAHAVRTSAHARDLPLASRRRQRSSCRATFAAMDFTISPLLLTLVERHTKNGYHAGGARAFVYPQRQRPATDQRRRRQRKGASIVGIGRSHSSPYSVVEKNIDDPTIGDKCSGHLAVAFGGK